MSFQESNPEVARRQALARHAAQSYAAHPKVAAVMLAGSVARGTADQFSDIELDIFWTEPATDEDRLALVAQASGKLLYQDADENEWADGFYIEGIKVDTSQFLVATIERWLADVVERADTEIDKQLLIAAVQHGQPLHGAELVERWQAKAAEYPDALVRAMVARHLSFQPRCVIEMFAERDDLLILHRYLVETQQLLMNVLMGLNRLYVSHPHYKWLDWQCAQLRVAPPDLARRLKQILRDEPRAAAARIHQLIEETFALIEQHLPAFDTPAARARYDEQRVIEKEIIHE